MNTVRRRTILRLLGSVPLLAATGACSENAGPTITVYKDPSCGCCNGWIKHLAQAGFSATAQHGANLAAVRKRLGVPDEVASCHTGEIAGYVIEGHVPAKAIQRLLTEKPTARGLAVAGMPIGSPGMEGPDPVPYDVVLFGDAGVQPYMRFLESNPIS